MRVVFLQDVANVAEAGEVKEVKRGYARNFLLPRNLAVPATSKELGRIDSLKRVAVQRRKLEVEETEAMGRRLEGVVVTLLQRAGPTGRLYGSVTKTAIAEELSKEVDYAIDRRAIEIGDPIRQTGEYKVMVRWGAGRTFDFKVVVTTEELLQQRDVNQEKVNEEVEMENSANGEGHEETVEAVVEQEPEE